MDNGLVIQDKTIKMGANSNPNAERIIALQERKQSIEETLAKRNQELRQLCIQEAELTGIMPTEIPLQPGESPPIFRRRIGTSFQLPQNLINNLDNEEESIASLELNMQVQANMAEAALSLANECNISKTVRRQHMTQYQYHKRQYNSWEEKLSFLKTRAQMSQQPHLPLQQQKQKKKPRPVDQDDAVSVTMQQTEPFGKSVFRHSMRSLQHSLSGESSIDSASTIYSKYGYRNLEYNQHQDVGGPLARTEEALVSGIYRLSLNGYKAYMDRKENTHIIGNSHVSPHFSSSPSNSSLYQHPSKQQLSNMQAGSHTLPHGSQRMQPPGHPFPMYPPQYSTNLHHCQSMHDYPKYPMGNIYNNNSLRQSNSSNCSGYSKTYCPSMYTNRPYSNIELQHRTSNPHQIQPHQQYEHSVMSTGLGGYWKRSESGELVWCNSSPNESWQRDKRFGSLDRRRNKRIHKKTSPLVDPKSATISTVTQYQETTRSAVPKAQIASRIPHDNRQLVRTQSLGSVGAQTVDNVWPSDDNSSCGSDAHSINELSVTVRKQKEWFETSLDGPASSPPSRPLSIVSSTIAASVISISPEEKYVETLPPRPLPSPQLHKPPLEIPAESHPHLSPTIHEPNLELFNNNIPKNGTLIQAGQCKPYHEETKPFEMSDFYKYSTKFKKSPVKAHNNHTVIAQLSPICLRNVNDNVDDNTSSGLQKGAGSYQPLKCRPINLNNNFETSVDGNTTPNNSMNTSLNLSQLTSNVAENFSTEMNMWYKNQEQQVDNTERDDISNRSTATLV